MYNFKLYTLSLNKANEYQYSLFPPSGHKIKLVCTNIYICVDYMCVLQYMDQ